MSAEKGSKRPSKWWSGVAFSLAYDSVACLVREKGRCCKKNKNKEESVHVNVAECE